MIRITRGDNPYAREVQGKANEPITVAALLDSARERFRFAGVESTALEGVTLEEIYDRLHYNAPRVAIIGGSPDHPAHIVDADTTAFAAARIWKGGGVPFAFAVPVLCDGTAQSNIGMSYSLVSRNITMAAVANQMEAHSYHGAFVIQGCDKQPLAVAAALAMLDVVRRARGDAPVFATFAPAHVLRGGTIPDDLKEKLGIVADIAMDSGHREIGEDLRDTLQYILQCSSNTAFQGVLTRAREYGVITTDEHEYFEKRLAVNTCDAKGGICAFNGTGNSSRHVMSAIGLVHPAIELLTGPATPAEINPAIDALLRVCDDPAFSVSEIVRANIESAVRIHSATGGSTNIMLHLVAVAIAAGLSFDVWDYDRIHHAVEVPDIFDYSLTAGRDIFALAQQCCSGQIRGMETVIYELDRGGIPLPLDAPTMSGRTWRERLSNTDGLAASGVTENPIILSTPRRNISGIDVLKGNWFDTAVVKISGMPEKQVDEFDEHVAAVLFFENEDEANSALLDVDFLQKVRDNNAISRDVLLSMAEYHQSLSGAGEKAAAQNGNSPSQRILLEQLDDASLFDHMLANNLLRLTIVIAGQGPEGFGMPEMFTPMQHINANRVLRRISVLISDGRYSGVTYGAAIGHITPEAAKGGTILSLQNGDLLKLSLRSRRIDLLDPVAFIQGNISPFDHPGLDNHTSQRRDLIDQRRHRLALRVRSIVPTNRLFGCTDASHGVVPLSLLELSETSIR